MANICKPKFYAGTEASSNLLCHTGCHSLCEGEGAGELAVYAVCLQSCVMNYKDAEVTAKSTSQKVGITELAAAEQYALYEDYLAGYVQSSFTVRIADAASVCRLMAESSSVSCSGEV